MEQLKLPTKKGIQTKDVDHWLNLSSTGKSLRLEYNNEFLYAPVSQIKQMMKNQRNELYFSRTTKKGDDVSFEETEIKIKHDKEMDQFIISDEKEVGEPRPLIAPADEVAMLIEEERESVKLSLLLRKCL